MRSLSSTHTPPSPVPQSATSAKSTTSQPLPAPPSSVASLPPMYAAPVAPPPSEASYRPRRTTIAHHSRNDSMNSIGKRSIPLSLSDQLYRIYEENPGTFFEAPTGVPDNTPKTSHAGTSTCSSPRSDRTNLQPTVFNLPKIIERLEQLPPPSVSRCSSPPSSITGESS